MTTMQTTTQGLAQNHWRKIKSAPQRLVLCRLMIDIMRTVHGAYAPDTDRFGTRLETAYAWRLAILRTSRLLSPRLLSI